MIGIYVYNLLRFTVVRVCIPWLFLCGILGTAPSCTPVLIEGGHSKKVIGGHTSLECELTTCDSVLRVLFAKTSFQSTHWTPVFEYLTNGTVHALKTGSNYTLNKRSVYLQFPTHHILNIDNVKFDDQGEWRCSIVDKNDNQLESNSIWMYLDTDNLSASHAQKNITYEPGMSVVITEQGFNITCRVDSFSPDVTVYVTLNGQEQVTQSSAKYLNDDGSWSMENVSNVHFTQLKNSIIGCEMRSNGKECAWKNFTVEDIGNYPLEKLSSVTQIHTKDIIITTVFIAIASVVTILIGIHCSLRKQIISIRGQYQPRDILFRARESEWEVDDTST